MEGIVTRGRVQDENEDANLPAIPDSGSPGMKCVGRMRKDTSRCASLPEDEDASFAFRMFTECT